MNNTTNSITARINNKNDNMLICVRNQLNKIKISKINQEVQIFGRYYIVQSRIDLHAAEHVLF